MVQILPGVDEYLSRGVKNLGETISLFTETDRRTEKAIRNMMLENPDFAQKFADLETKSPGTLKKLGFGKLSDTITQLGPSLALQREQLLGQRELEAESALLGLKEFRNNTVLTELQRNPTISAIQMGALVSEALGIPRDAELEGEIYDLVPKELQAMRARYVLEAAERGENVDGSMQDFVMAWRAGQDDPSTTQAILAHPLLAPQFEAMNDLLSQREANELDKELADLRAKPNKIPTSLQNQINEIATIKPVLGMYEQLLQRWFKLNRAERIGAIAGAGTKENQELAGSLQSLRQQLAGRLRLAIIGPGAVSDQERRALLNSIGNALSFGALVRAPEFTFGQFNTLKTSLDAIEKALDKQSGMISGEWTPERKSMLIDELITLGYKNDEITTILSRMEEQSKEEDL